MASLGVVILTYNEEIHIERAIRSVLDIADDIVVVDSGSTDRTIAIATGLGARVFHHEFVNHAQQITWGLEAAAFTTEWVLRLDADEVIGQDLQREITSRLDTLPKGVNGVNLKRRHVFLGRWIKHGGRYPIILLRLWRNGTAKVENRWMDEHMVLESGSSITFNNDFSDENLHDISFFTEKHNKYSTKEAIDVIIKDFELGNSDNSLERGGASNQAKIKRIIKSRVFNRIPFYFSAPMYFLYRYVLQLGFLDGVEGAIYHFLQGFWYRFLVGAKLVELKRAIRPLDGKNARLIALTELTGFQVKLENSNV